MRYRHLRPCRLALLGAKAVLQATHTVLPNTLASSTTIAVIAVMIVLLIVNHPRRKENARFQAWLGGPEQQSCENAQSFPSSHLQVHSVVGREATHRVPSFEDLLDELLVLCRGLALKPHPNLRRRQESENARRCSRQHGGLKGVSQYYTAATSPALARASALALTQQLK